MEMMKDRLDELKAAGETGAGLSPGDPLSRWAYEEIKRLRGKKLVLDPESLTLLNRDHRIDIHPGGLYVTVGGQPTECMFAGGCDHVNLRLTREEARIIGRWLLEQAAAVP
jgi:hypothetical protein